MVFLRRLSTPPIFPPREGEPTTPPFLLAFANVRLEWERGEGSREPMIIDVTDVADVSRMRLHLCNDFRPRTYSTAAVFLYSSGVPAWSSPGPEIARLFVRLYSLFSQFAIFINFSPPPLFLKLAVSIPSYIIKINRKTTKINFL